jgi:hypothetical protein
MLVACSGTSQQSNQTTSFSTFDASAPKSTINADDSVQMTLDQCTDVAPSYWNTQNHIMTVPVPILFNDNRIPTLKIEKILNPLSETLLNQISISGLEQGDVIISPVSGEIQITADDENLNAFELLSTDAQGDQLGMMITTQNGLNPLINSNVPAADQEIDAPITEGQPIGKITTQNTSIIILGSGPAMESFNLATTPEGKAILLTK